MKVVRWKSPSPQSTRQITAKEWETAGVEDQDTVVWGAANDWTVPAADVTDHAMRHLMLDGQFVVEGEDTKGKDDDQPAVSEREEIRGTDRPRNKRGGR